MLELRPLILRMISLGAIVGGALTRIWTWSPLTVVGWNYDRQAEPQGKLRSSRIDQQRVVNPIAIAGVC